MFKLKKEDWANGLNIFVPGEEIRLAPQVFKDFKRFCRSFSEMFLFALSRVAAWALFPVAYLVGVFGSAYIRQTQEKYKAFYWASFEQ